MLLAGHGEVGVGDDHPSGTVRRNPPPAQLTSGRPASPCRCHQRDVGIGEQAASHETGHHRDAEPARARRPCPPGRSGAPRRRAIRHRAFLPQACEDLVRHRPRASASTARGASHHRRGMAPHDHVAQDLDIHRQRIAHAVAEHARCRLARVPASSSRTWSQVISLEDAGYCRVQRLGLVVQQQAGLAFAQPSPPR